MTEREEQIGTLIPPGLVRPIVLFLQVFHWVVVLYSALGWLANTRGLLIFYMIYLPAMMVQWHFNQNTCVINNIETWLKSGEWRDEKNPEEGAFIHTWLLRVTGLDIPKSFFDTLIRAVMVVLWFVALMKLRGLSG